MVNTTTLAEMLDISLPDLPPLDALDDIDSSASQSDNSVNVNIFVLSLFAHPSPCVVRFFIFLI